MTKLSRMLTTEYRIYNIHQFYLVEQHRDSFKIWSVIFRIITLGKSVIMKSNRGQIVINVCLSWMNPFKWHVCVVVHDDLFCLFKQIDSKHVTIG